MYFSIDRIIDTKAVLIGEDAKPLEVPLSLLPKDVKTGDMLFYTDDGKFQFDPHKTKERRERVAEMLGKLLNSKEEKQE